MPTSGTTIQVESLIARERANVGRVPCLLIRMKLSIIDQSPVASGSTPAQALLNTISLAKLADRIGY